MNSNRSLQFFEDHHLIHTTSRLASATVLTQLTAYKIDVKMLKRCFVEHLGYQAIYRCLYGHLYFVSNTGMINPFRHLRWKFPKNTKQLVADCPRCHLDSVLLMCL